MTGIGVVDILVVEDDPDDLSFTLRAIRTANLAEHVEIVRDGAEAIDFMFCQGAFSGRSIEDVPRLILLDLNLPGMNGLHVLRRLKGDARTRRVPVVLFSSSPDPREVVESYDLGVNSYIVKPPTFELARETVQFVVRYWLTANLPATNPR